MLPNSVGCLLRVLTLRAREGADEVDDGYSGGIRIGRPRSCIEVIHRNMAPIQSLFLEGAHQQFGGKRVRGGAQPQAKQNRPSRYRHWPLPFAGQFFTVLTEDEPGILIVQDRGGPSLQASGFAAQSG